MTVELHPEADAEFAAAVDHYAAAETRLGHRFYEAIMGTLEWIAVNPTLPRIRTGYRRVNVRIFPFYIAYAYEPDLIWVLAIAHCSRKPGYWKKRLRNPL